LGMDTPKRQLKNISALRPEHESFNLPNRFTAGRSVRLLDHPLVEIGKGEWEGINERLFWEVGT
jgi:hypothetical protein